MIKVVAKSVLAIGVLIGFTSFFSADKGPVKEPFSNADSQWVDSVMNQLSLKEKIGQLFMVAAYSNKDANHVAAIEKAVTDYGIGGVIFFQGGPVRQAKLTNRYQSLAKVPLLVAMDAEWGLGMRLDSTISYPRQMMLGALPDNELLYTMGQHIGEQCNRLGVHINFAPVVDVNVNPKNPVINSRSFGEDKQNVAFKSLAYMNGMQDQKVMAVAKHFPGHGDTDKDSHKALPLISHDVNRLNNIELYPFKTLFDSGCAGVMVAHLLVPALDSTPDRATTLSPKVVTDLLQKKLNYKGLIFTDALNMKGVSNYYKPGHADLLALKAGNDVLLFPKDVPLAIKLIEQAIKKGEISEEELDAHVRKIIKSKYWAGLNNYQPIEIKNLYADLNTDRYKHLYRELIGQSITLAKNTDALLPYKNLDQKKIAVVCIGGKKDNVFVRRLQSYAKVEAFYASKQPSAEEVKALLGKLEPFSEVIVSFHKPSRSPRKNFGIPAESTALLKKIATVKSVTQVNFCNPYALNKMETTSKLSNAIIVAYNEKYATQEKVAQLIFGGIGAKGSLPVSAGGMEKGTGYATTAIRFSYATPQDAGFNYDILKNVDSIAENAIEKGATPGCQLVILKDNQVVWNKAYGYHTYDKKKRVKTTDLYDVASITKTVATLPSLMKLQHEGKISVDGTLGNYLPDLVKGTEYEHLTIREILAHNAGLKSWIPFYLHTIENGVPRYDVYSLEQTKTYPTKVAENLYIHKSYTDSMMQLIVQTPLKNRGEYRYSDLGYYFMQEIIERKTNMPLEDYALQSFYAPLGMWSTTYLPNQKFNVDDIVPTEDDTYFRNQLINGTVHDPGAAMMGGVGGHAGVFSNALDMAKIWQMYLNNGSYGGQQILDSAILAEYEECQYCLDSTEGNRRGIGFDKPVRDGGSGPTCDCVDFHSFGHTGFTGTIAWADPKEQLVYVFLSNRIYPTAENRKLISMNVRTDIMQTIYDAMHDSSYNNMAVNH